MRYEGTTAYVTQKKTGLAEGYLKTYCSYHGDRESYLLYLMLSPNVSDIIKKHIFAGAYIFISYMNMQVHAC